MPTDVSQDDPTSQMNESLSQILRWVKFQSLDRARQIIEKEIAQDPKQILVYELADGERGRPEVSRVSGVPSSTIQVWWDRWFKLGIMEASPKRKGMLRRLCSIEEVGLDIPKDVRIVLDRRSGSPSAPPNMEPVGSASRDSVE